MHLASHISSNITSHIPSAGASPPGGELINADVSFDTTTGWTLDPEYTITGGNLVATYVGNDGVVLANTVSRLDRNTLYTLSGNIVSLSAPTGIFFDVGTLADGTGTVVTVVSPDSFSQTFVPNDIAPSFDWEGSDSIVQISVGTPGDTFILADVSLVVTP